MIERKKEDRYSQRQQNWKMLARARTCLRQLIMVCWVEQV